MSSKRVHCTIEGLDETPVVEIFDYNNSPPRASKATKRTSKRRKAAPRTTSFVANGSLPSPSDHSPVTPNPDPDAQVQTDDAPDPNTQLPLPGDDNSLESDDEVSEEYLERDEPAPSKKVSSLRGHDSRLTHTGWNRTQIITYGSGLQKRVLYIFRPCTPSMRPQRMRFAIPVDKSPGIFIAAPPALAVLNSVPLA